MGAWPIWPSRLSRSVRLVAKPKLRSNNHRLATQFRLGGVVVKKSKTSDGSAGSGTVMGKVFALFSTGTILFENAGSAKRRPEGGRWFDTPDPSGELCLGT